ncbi:MAG: hypothetical protein JWQ19_2505 [Subtercola sp.]|nr:hypothetical protein [Subtercola sp.]
MATIKRRTALQAAWAAPVVALAIGAPAHASSIVPGISIAWLPDGADYEVVYTNNTGGVIPATTAFVRLTSYTGVTDVQFNAAEWSSVEGELLTVLNVADLADGASSIVYSTVKVGPPPVNALVEAYSDDYYDSAVLNL